MSMSLTISDDGVHARSHFVLDRVGGSRGNGERPSRRRDSHRWRHGQLFVVRGQVLSLKDDAVGY
jgi:hypothetical protein